MAKESNDEVLTHTYDSKETTKGKNHETNYEQYIEKGYTREGDGHRFTVWAPHAKAVSFLSNRTNWDTGLQMERVPHTGNWTCFLEEADQGEPYKYLIEQADGKKQMKIDPFAFEFEIRPKDASIIRTLPQKKWKDQKWMKSRKRFLDHNYPLNIYEVHASSWKQHQDGSFYSFIELQRELLPYVKEMGYTHIEFLPLMEHPLDESWGYQTVGYFAFSSKYGTIEEFQTFVEAAHRAGIGVLMDWVPAHFNLNDYGLAYFDGTPQFEYKDENQALNKRWGTGNFDLGKEEVQNFLVSSAAFWLDTFHLDGLRVDAVSSMLYLDYDEGEWTPNEEGTNVNLEGKAFVQFLTQTIREAFPETLLIAEESTSWKGVTAPVENDGLGFHYKWNMGWMTDTLSFFETEPYKRKEKYRLMTFSFMYMLDENYLLPFSHDEVVHGKKSLMNKMPGDRYNQFANLRTMEVWRMTHPGKKLSFMGNEYGQFLEWRDNESLEWSNEKDEQNQKHLFFIAHLNHFYLTQHSLWELDDSAKGIKILEADNAEEAILSYIRMGKKKKDFLIVLFNLMPIERKRYRVGVPYKGIYEEVLNTERSEFGGTWIGSQGEMTTQDVPQSEYPYSLELILPAMSAVILRPKRIYK